MQGVQGVPGPQGPPGATGPAGADGQLRIYGNASAGDLNITSTTTLVTAVPTGNLQFHNVTINTGATFNIPSGTIFHCTGNFTNSGTLVVSGGALPPSINGFGNPGVSPGAAEPGQSAASTSIAPGGSGGRGLGLEQSLVFLDAPIEAGGSGASSSGVSGGSGGGSVLILAQGTIINNGSILANGGNGTFVGAGGGAGGIIILASPTSITSPGLIRASGGNGGAANNQIGGGGGGGGGLVRFLSPVVSLAGTVSVAGGTGGAPSLANVSPRLGGSGGGACAGNGGSGGLIDAAPLNITHSGDPGAVGQIITTLTDPTALFW